MPVVIPIIFNSVILSLKSQAAINMMSIGVTKPSNDACMEDVSDKPFTEQCLV